MFRALLVDDEELALVSLRCSFPWEEYGFTDIITTTNPLEALSILNNEHIDVAFVDIRMPELSGLELIALAKENHSTAQFVIVSGYSDFSYAKKAIHLGTLDYCLKPVDSEEAAFTLEKISDHVFRQRISEDPKLVSLLLSDYEACQNFLQTINPDFVSCEAFTLLYIHAEKLQQVLSHAKKYPRHVLFFSDQEALFFWDHPFSANDISEMISPYLSQALFISDYSKPTVGAFQTSIKRLRVECHNQNQTKKGLIQLSNICSEMTDYFSTMLTYIDEHYKEKLTLQDLSHQFGVNYTYLSQLFKKTIGKTFPEYLTSVRISHAKKLLSDTEMKIMLIAETVGFNDYHYFCNVFKHSCSMSPAQYRNSIKHRKEKE